MPEKKINKWLAIGSSDGVDMDLLKHWKTGFKLKHTSMASYPTNKPG